MEAIDSQLSKDGAASPESISPISVSVPSLDSFLHEAGQVELKLSEIDAILSAVWKKERKAYQLLGSVGEEKRASLLELSSRIEEIQNVLQELKLTQRGNSLAEIAQLGSEEAVEDAKYKQYAYHRLLQKFLDSSELNRLDAQLASFIAQLSSGSDSANGDADAPGLGLKIDTSGSLRKTQSAETMLSPGVGAPSTERQGLPFFESLYKDFHHEVKQVAELDRKLKDSESRLKSRDEYLQNTIIETAKRVHMLEQTVAELESEKEDLRNDYLNLEARTQGVLARQPSLIDVPLRTPTSSNRFSQQIEMKEEMEVVQWIKDMDSSPSPTSSTGKLAEREQQDNEQLLELAQTLTTLAEEKELLESDLCIVRLQVEHLEAISRERDAILQDLMEKRMADKRSSLMSGGSSPLSPTDKVRRSSFANQKSRSRMSVQQNRASLVLSK
ncbi:hypothetical protein HDV03_000548 [Kappamyces sp. JEL0829]|nr:hypothetical protein HDV03_000548 [Kappamyces sp. JEL0829]